MAKAFDSIFTYKAVPKDALASANKQIVGLLK